MAKLKLEPFSDDNIDVKSRKKKKMSLIFLRISVKQDVFVKHKCFHISYEIKFKIVLCKSFQFGTV